MPIGAQDLDAFEEAFKTMYEDEVQDLTILSSWYLQQLQNEDPEAFKGGHGYEWRAKVQRNPSYGIGLLDGGFVPKPGHDTVIPASQDVIDFSASTGLTEDLVNRGKKGPAAFLDAVQDCVDGVVEPLQSKISAMALRPQIVSVTANSSSSTSLVVATTQYWQVGAEIVVGNRTTGVEVGRRRITAKNPNTNTLTLNTAISATAATDSIWYVGAGPTAPIGIDSLAHACTETRTLHGINSATYPSWAGNAVNKGGAVADLADFSKLRDRLARRGAKGVKAVTTFGIMRRFANQMQSQKQFVNAEATTLRGGFKELYIDDIQLGAEPDAPVGYCFVWDQKKVKLIQGKYGWVTAPSGGNGIWRQSIGIDGDGDARYKFEWETTYATTLNIRYKDPKTCGMLENCQDEPPIGDA